MNFCSVSGWTTTAPDERFRSNAERVLTWKGWIRNRARSEQFQFNFEIADPALVEEALAKLVPGQTYLIEDAELTTRPYNKHGVHKGDIEVLLVHAMTFGRAAKPAGVAQEIAEGAEKK